MRLPYNIARCERCLLAHTAEVAQQRETQGGVFDGMDDSPDGEDEAKKVGAQELPHPLRIGRSQTGTSTRRRAWLSPLVRELTLGQQWYCRLLASCPAARQLGGGVQHLLGSMPSCAHAPAG